MSKRYVRLPGATPWRGPDRRSGQDRRRVEGPPPGGRERRVSLEPRMPDVQELEFTPSQWDALHEFQDTER